MGTLVSELHNLFCIVCVSETWIWEKCSNWLDASPLVVFAIICTRRTGASTKRGSDGGKKAGRGKGVVFRKLGVASAKIRVGLKEESLILMCQARAWESKRRPGAIRLSCNCTQSNGQRVSREQEVVCHRVVMRDVWCMDPRARIWNLLSFFAHLGIWALASYNSDITLLTMTFTMAIVLDTETVY